MSNLQSARHLMGATKPDLHTAEFRSQVGNLVWKYNSLFVKFTSFIINYCYHASKKVIQKQVNDAAGTSRIIYLLGCPACLKVTALNPIMETGTCDV